MPNSDPYPNAMCGDLGLPSFGCQVSDGIRLEWKVAFLCPFHSMPVHTLEREEKGKHFRIECEWERDARAVMHLANYSEASLTFSSNGADDWLYPYNHHLWSMSRFLTSSLLAFSPENLLFPAPTTIPRAATPRAPLPPLSSQSQRRKKQEKTASVWQRVCENV